MYALNTFRQSRDRLMVDDPEELPLVLIPQYLQSKFLALRSVPLYYFDYVGRVQAKGKVYGRVAGLSSEQIAICGLRGGVKRCIDLRDIVDILVDQTMTIPSPGRDATTSLSSDVAARFTRVYITVRSGYNVYLQVIRKAFVFLRALSSWTRVPVRLTRTAQEFDGRLQMHTLRCPRGCAKQAQRAFRMPPKTYATHPELAARQQCLLDLTDTGAGGCSAPTSPAESNKASMLGDSFQRTGSPLLWDTARSGSSVDAGGSVPRATRVSQHHRPPATLCTSGLSDYSSEDPQAREQHNAAVLLDEFRRKTAPMLAAVPAGKSLAAAKPSESRLAARATPPPQLIPPAVQLETPPAGEESPVTELFVRQTRSASDKEHCASVADADATCPLGSVLHVDVDDDDDGDAAAIPATKTLSLDGGGGKRPSPRRRTFKNLQLQVPSGCMLVASKSEMSLAAQESSFFVSPCTDALSTAFLQQPPAVSDGGVSMLSPLTDPDAQVLATFASEWPPSSMGDQDAECEGTASTSQSPTPKSLGHRVSTGGSTIRSVHAHKLHLRGREGQGGGGANHGQITAAAGDVSATSLSAGDVDLDILSGTTVTAGSTNNAAAAATSSPAAAGAAVVDGRVKGEAAASMPMLPESRAQEANRTPSLTGHLDSFIFGAEVGSVQAASTQGAESLEPTPLQAPLVIGGDVRAAAPAAIPVTALLLSTLPPALRVLDGPVPISILPAALPVDHQAVSRGSSVATAATTARAATGPGAVPSPLMVCPAPLLAREAPLLVMPRGAAAAVSEGEGEGENEGMNNGNAARSPSRPCATATIGTQTPPPPPPPANGPAPVATSPQQPPPPTSHNLGPHSPPQLPQPQAAVAPAAVAPAAATPSSAAVAVGEASGSRPTPPLPGACASAVVVSPLRQSRIPRKAAKAGFSFRYEAGGGIRGESGGAADGCVDAILCGASAVASSRRVSGSSTVAATVAAASPLWGGGLSAAFAAAAAAADPPTDPAPATATTTTTATTAEATPGQSSEESNGTSWLVARRCPSQSHSDAASTSTASRRAAGLRHVASTSSSIAALLLGKAAPTSPPAGGVAPRVGASPLLQIAYPQHLARGAPAAVPAGAASPSCGVVLPAAIALGSPLARPVRTAL